MNPALEQLFRDFQDHKTWVGKCVSKIYEAASSSEAVLNESIIPGLVGRNGAPGVVANNLSGWKREQIWGISIALCNEYCSRSSFGMVFNYQTFLGRATNYLLPWLALTAQLPYEAGDIITNIMCFFMGVGSPMTLTFSLMMTIFNRRWLREKVRRFHSEFPGSGLAPRLKDAGHFLEAAQQVPLRMNHGAGWLASLVVLDSNGKWWERLGGRLLATKRGVTLSLVVQILVAVAAWILTIIGTFGSSLGNHAEGLVLSSSTLWTWLVPVICGWISVGTQNKADAVEVALRADDADLAEDEGVCVPGIQRAFEVMHPDASDQMNLLGCGIHGDETKPGPVYNYARIFTWRHTATQLIACFHSAAAELQAHSRELAGAPPRQPRERRGSIPLDKALGSAELLHFQAAADVGRVTRCCRLPAPDGDQQLTVYPQSDELDADFWWQVVGAIITALFVQWGTAGPAIIIAYLTDVKGLGCRSGSYLIYGVVSTVAFGLFFLSVVCSRAALLRHQKTGGRKGVAFNVFRALAVGFRLLGRTLAIGNALWLIITSLFELVGFFDNCWCEGVVLVWGQDAWVVVFKSAVDLAENASGPWGGSIAMSSCVMLFSYVWFALLCRKPR
ncbi:hypothetical protein QBC42DRAFT_270579 [Cladorrhinum samala]|uniref:Uncharacterized protein n=1 Tax=Cladorrhinum samala TaxID=585594 RepID=A0AAV9HQE4_9PEZI|nr:hypothetical protein QBC42DRAFT_270579 [Cladorrhinum samala]